MFLPILVFSRVLIIPSQFLKTFQKQKLYASLQCSFPPSLRVKCASYLRKTLKTLNILCYFRLLQMESLQMGLFISLEVRNQPDQYDSERERERLSVTRKNSLHSFTFKLQMQPGFEFLYSLNS